MTRKNISMKNRIQSFRYALDGYKVLLKEPNARIHIFISICVIIAGIILNISRFEWIAVIFAIGLVICMEAINTSIEHLADFVSPEKHKLIKKVKDVAAFAVLISAIISVIVGLLIFVPKI